MENNIKGWEIVKTISQKLQEHGSLQKTLNKHNKNWLRLYNYAQEQNMTVDFKSIDSINALIQEYLLSNMLVEDVDLQSALYSFKILKEFLITGHIRVRLQTFDFSGEIGDKMMELITEKEAQHVSLSTINIYRLRLSRLLDSLNEQGVNELEQLRKEHITYYISQLRSEYKSDLYQSVLHTRFFLKWLYSKKLISFDIAVNIPSPKVIKQPKLPSVYSTEEITALLNGIDRSNPVGKRNYICLLLAARLALRSSDIRNLKFSNIFWEENIIKLNQVKTGRIVELPLLPEIGNALVDYLKYGRPESNAEFVFLTSKPPYEQLKHAAMYRMITKSFKRARVDISERRHGLHALRHSLSSRLLENLTAIPVIAETLGHVNTSTTLSYFRIDITSLMSCALDAPQLNESFYEQFKW